MKRSRFPAGWNEARARVVLEHYEKQTEEEAVAEDEAAFHLNGQTVMVVPRVLVPKITRLIEGERTSRQTGLASGKPSQPAPQKTRRS